MNSNQERLNNIRKYKQKQEEKERMEELKKENDREYFLEKVQELNERISDLLDTAIMCKECGISLTCSYKRTYKNNDFIADRITHKLGFVSDFKNGEYNGIGVLGGGYYNYDLMIIKSDNQFKVIETGDDIQYARNTFIKHFEDFETMFYAYVDRVVRD